MSAGTVLLIIGAAVLQIQPQSLGCKYGEELSKTKLIPLGDWDKSHAEYRMVCKDGEGELIAYETPEQVCERAKREMSLQGSIYCVKAPLGYKP